MNKEKLALTKEQALEIIYGDNKDFKKIQEEIVDTSRWSIIYSIVAQRISDGKYFSDDYSTGATEGQDESPFQYTEPNFTEVFPVEKKVIVYE